MKNKRALLLFLCCFLMAIPYVKSTTLGDTIKVSIPKKKKKTYPSQPLVLKTSVTGFMYGGVFPFTSEYRLAAEITTGRTQSEQVSIAYLGKNVFWAIFEKASNQSTGDILKVNGWRIQYAHKIYLVNRRHHSPYGFYVAPHVSYTNAHISLGLNRYYRDVYFDVRHLNANLLIGVQVGKLGRLTMDVCGGAGYKTNTVYYHSSAYRITKYDTSDFGSYYNGHMHLMFDISLGYSL